MSTISSFKEFIEINNFDFVFGFPVTESMSSLIISYNFVKNGYENKDLYIDIDIEILYKKFIQQLKKHFIPFKLISYKELLHQKVNMALVLKDCEKYKTKQKKIYNLRWVVVQKNDVRNFFYENSIRVDPSKILYLYSEYLSTGSKLSIKANYVL